MNFPVREGGRLWFAFFHFLFRRRATATNEADQATQGRVSIVERKRESAPEHMRNGVATTQGRTQNDSGRVRSTHCRWPNCSRGSNKKQGWEGGNGELSYIEIMCASAFGFQFSIFHLHRPLRLSLDQQQQQEQQQERQQTFPLMPFILNPLSSRSSIHPYVSQSIRSYYALCHIS